MTQGLVNEWAGDECGTQGDEGSESADETPASALRERHPKPLEKVRASCGRITNCRTFAPSNFFDAPRNPGRRGNHSGWVDSRASPARPSTPAASAPRPRPMSRPRRRSVRRLRQDAGRTSPSAGCVKPNCRQTAATILSSEALSPITATAQPYAKPRSRRIASPRTTETAKPPAVKAICPAAESPAAPPVSPLGQALSPEPSARSFGPASNQATSAKPSNQATPQRGPSRPGHLSARQSAGLLRAHATAAPPTAQSRSPPAASAPAVGDPAIGLGHQQRHRLKPAPESSPRASPSPKP